MISLRQTAIELRKISRVLWVRVSLIAALSVLVTLAAPILDPILPKVLQDRFSEDAVLPVLTILANTMLAVATFSLGVMVSSHRTLASITTPRIHRLLMEDTSTQSTLATFVGAFVYALSSIILFRAGYYKDEAIVVVFFATVFVVLAIVVSLIRWINKLSRIGSLDYALERAEQAAREALYAFRKSPTLGATPINSGGDFPEEAELVCSSISGFLRSVDVARLQSMAEEADAAIYILVHPGDLVLEGQPLARVVGTSDKDSFAKAFAIGQERSHEQDPRYALLTLRETASRALSPGINDPGTAIAVVSRLEILWFGFYCSETPEDGEYAANVFAKPLATADLIETSFQQIARDGAAFFEVLEVVAKAYQSLNSKADVKAKQTLSDLKRELRDYAEGNLDTEFERARVIRAVEDGWSPTFSIKN